MADEWDEQAFQQRVDDRLAVIGKSRSGALKDIDESEDLLRDRGKAGRRIDTILKIVRALDWTLAGALNIPPTSHADVSLLGMALEVALKRFPPRRLLGGPNIETIAEAAAVAYDSLAERAEKGNPPRDREEAIAQVEATVRAYVDGRRRGENSNKNN